MTIFSMTTNIQEFMKMVDSFNSEIEGSRLSLSVMCSCILVLKKYISKK